MSHMISPSRTDWRTIGILIAVSALAQVGQFGIVFIVLPLWLTERGLDAAQLGLFNSMARDNRSNRT